MTPVRARLKMLSFVKFCEAINNARACAVKVSKIRQVKKRAKATKVPFDSLN